MPGKRYNVIADEVESRLDDLLEGKDMPGHLSGVDGSGYSSQDQRLGELKAIILSIEWEITDQVMNRLVEEIDRTKDIFENDKTILLFLQLLGSIGKYIRTKKAKAHPDAIRLLHSVYDNLERITVSQEMTVSQKKKILSGEVNKLNLLKKQIAVAKTVASAKAKTKPGEELKRGQKEKDLLSSSDMKDMAPGEALAFALEEIKRTIKAEFMALRSELQLWKQRQ